LPSKALAVGEAILYSAAANPITKPSHIANNELVKMNLYWLTGKSYCI
jgi:hypothetical protein